MTVAANTEEYKDFTTSLASGQTWDISTNDSESGIFASGKELREQRTLYTKNYKDLFEFSTSYPQNYTYNIDWYFETLSAIARPIFIEKSIREEYEINIDGYIVIDTNNGTGPWVDDTVRNGTETGCLYMKNDFKFIGIQATPDTRDSSGSGMQGCYVHVAGTTKLYVTLDYTGITKTNKVQIHIHGVASGPLNWD
jgi:hypothetical protein